MTGATASITDFHSHILPGIDDGSQHVEMTLAMLARMTEQGIGRVVATPHFYPMHDSAERFLARRKAAVEALRARYDGAAHPQIFTGAEVAYYHGLSQSDRLGELCIQGTRCLLLEMPFTRWSGEDIREVLAIRERWDLQPILAHVERYLAFQRRGTIEFLVREGILIQANAEFFLDKKTGRKARRLLAQGQIHLLGSDCHNLADRPPNLGSAVQALSEMGFGESLQNVEACGNNLLSSAVSILK